MKHQDSIAVLTGDLVGSTGLTDAQIRTAFSMLENEVVAVLKTWAGQTLQPVFARSRGDGWQMRLGQPAFALRCALFVRAALKSQHEDAASSNAGGYDAQSVRPSGVRTRIAIATGFGDPATPENLNEATGPVFVASGRALDAMPKGATLAHASGGPLAAATRLADHISADWTQPQAKAMQHALAPDAPTRAEIGAALGKSRQAVDQALAAAGYKALSDALRLIEE